MKISIRIKVILLGILLSLFVSVFSVGFSILNYRSNLIHTLNDRVDKSIEEVDQDMNKELSSDSYLGWEIVQSVVEYIDDVYKHTTIEDSEDMSFASRYELFHDNFPYIYGAKGLGMSQDSLTFRLRYLDLISVLYDARINSSANCIYIARFDEEKQQFLFLADSRFSSSSVADNEAMKEFYLPGSFITLDNVEEYETDESLNKTYMVDEKYSRSKEITNADTGKVIAYMFVEYDYDKINSDTSSMLLRESLSMLGTNVFLIVVFALMAHFLLIKNINRLNSSTLEFKNNLNKGNSLSLIDPKIKSHDEIKTLSNSFLSMEEALIDYIDTVQKETKEKEKMQAELSVASTIQQEALPPRNYHDKNITLQALFEAAKVVGGDFYDYFYLDKNHFAFVISDVSGKGIPAALFMMRAKEAIKTRLLSNASLKSIMKDVNNELLQNNDAGLFVTSFVGVIDLEKEVLSFINAGHEKPYLLRDGLVTRLDCQSNFILGGIDDFEYQEESIPFNKSDALFLFTDGLNEAINEKEEEFSYKRIVQVLEKHPDDILESMIKSLKEFTHGNDLFDDTTMLYISYPDDTFHVEMVDPEIDSISALLDNFQTKHQNLDKQYVAEICIILDELINNIISYEKTKPLKIEIDFSYQDGEGILTIKNNGQRFDPFEQEKRVIEEFSMDLAEGGLGLTIVKSLSKEFTYEYQDNKNVLIIKK